jgi:hypothetical protein
MSGIMSSIALRRVLRFTEASSCVEFPVTRLYKFGCLTLEHSGQKVCGLEVGKNIKIPTIIDVPSLSSEDINSLLKYQNPR